MPESPPFTKGFTDGHTPLDLGFSSPIFLALAVKEKEIKAFEMERVLGPVGWGSGVYSLTHSNCNIFTKSTLLMRWACEKNSESSSPPSL